MSEGILSDAERALLRTIAVVWEEFLALPHDDPDEIREARRTLHELQDKILARAARRTLTAKEGRSI
jgi:hypothetical protein